MELCIGEDHQQLKNTSLSHLDILYYSVCDIFSLLDYSKICIKEGGPHFFRINSKEPYKCACSVCMSASYRVLHSKCTYIQMEWRNEGALLHSYNLLYFGVANNFCKKRRNVSWTKWSSKNILKEKRGKQCETYMKVLRTTVKMDKANIMVMDTHRLGWRAITTNVLIGNGA